MIRGGAFGANADLMGIGAPDVVDFSNRLAILKALFCPFLSESMIGFVLSERVSIFKFARHPVKGAPRFYTVVNERGAYRSSPRRGHRGGERGETALV